MNTLLSERTAALAIVEALETWKNREAGEELAAIVRPRAMITCANWSAMPERAAAVATTLESTAFDTSSGFEGALRLNVATMIRVRAGGVARRGGPFVWKQSGPSTWDATGPSGTEWTVVGSDLIVARWDRPDWGCASPNEAKRVAAEIDARPNFPERLQLPEREVIIPDGPELEALAPQPEVPDWATVCDQCRSAERPVGVKPVRLSPLWWDDPAAYWRCPECNASRGRLDREYLERIREEIREGWRPPQLPQPFPRRVEDL